MSTLRVELGERSYNIEIEKGLLDVLGERIKGLGFSGSVTLVTNEKVNSLYGARVISSLEGAGFTADVIFIPDGEKYKTLGEVSKVFDALIASKAERGAPLIALGGGVIGDMAGFVAATYLRGVPYIQVPTTLLAQVDSSVGGKTGVNHPLGKNLIGAFYQPKAVYIDPEVLSTLDGRDYCSGLSEVVKYGVIWDEGFFSFLEDNAAKLRERSASDELIEAIQRSCLIKAEVVATDEREGGVRAILNLGHTFGHAIESLSGYGTYRHGEAVAIGMCMASRISLELGLCEKGDAERIRALVKTLGLPDEPPQIEPSEFIAAMLLDKKVVAGEIRFVLIESLGKVRVMPLSKDVLTGFLEKLGMGVN